MGDVRCEVERDPSGSQPHADVHARHDRRDVAEVRVAHVERHPVPVAERDLPAAGPGGSRRARPCRSSGSGRRSRRAPLGCRCTRRSRRPPAVGQLGDHVDQGLCEPTSTVWVAPSCYGAVERVATRVGDDDPAWAAQLHQLLREVAHEARADEHHVVASRTSASSTALTAQANGSASTVSSGNVTRRRSSTPPAPRRTRRSRARDPDADRGRRRAKPSTSSPTSATMPLTSCPSWSGYVGGRPPRPGLQLGGAHPAAGDPRPAPRRARATAPARPRSRTGRGRSARALPHRRLLTWAQLHDAVDPGSRHRDGVHARRCSSTSSSVEPPAASWCTAEATANGSRTERLTSVCTRTPSLPRS